MQSRRCVQHVSAQSIGGKISSSKHPNQHTRNYLSNGPISFPALMHPRASGVFVWRLSERHIITPYEPILLLGQREPILLLGQREPILLRGKCEPVVFRGKRESIVLRRQREAFGSVFDVAVTSGRRISLGMGNDGGLEGQHVVGNDCPFFRVELALVIGEDMYGDWCDAAEFFMLLERVRSLTPAADSVP